MSGTEPAHFANVTPPTQHPRTDRAPVGSRHEPRLSAVAARRSHDRHRSRHVWGAAFGAIIVLAGLAGSALFASGWRSNVLDSNKKAFQSTATDVRTALDSNLDANLSQTRTLSAIATMEPNAGATRFLQWYQQLKKRGAAPSASPRR